MFTRALCLLLVPTISFGAPVGQRANDGPESLAALFPLGTGGKSWTTSTKSDKSLPLSDATLQPFKLLKALSHDYVKAPDGQLAMEANYPKGSMNPGNSPQGGISFYSEGPKGVVKYKGVTCKNEC